MDISKPSAGQEVPLPPFSMINDICMLLGVLGGIQRGRSTGTAQASCGSLLYDNVTEEALICCPKADF